MIPDQPLLQKYICLFMQLAMNYISSTLLYFRVGWIVVSYHLKFREFLNVNEILKIVFTQIMIFNPETINQHPFEGLR